MNRPVSPGDEIITCFRDGTVTLRKNRRVRGFTESLKEIGYQGIRRGDLVIHAMDAFAGAIGVADSDGKGTPVYSVCQPSTECDSHYYAFLLREMARSQWIQALATGIRERSTDFRFEAFSAQALPCPPRGEQVAIVLFLNQAERRIRRYIRAKQKLIRLLEEQKHVIIHRAVTRGLRSNVRLKSSGVACFGEVPEQWEILPIKRAFVSMVYGISESATNEGTIRLLTMSNIRNGSVTVPVAGGVNGVDPSLLLMTNDLLFNRTNSAELVGKVGLFKGTENPVTFASYLVRMRSRSDMNPEFLNLLLNDNSVLAAARREAIPSLHQSNLNPTRYGRLHIAVPKVSEQDAIVRFLDDATSVLNRALDRAAREIILLGEYRTRMIADVVTGKVDVRCAAAALPRGSAEVEESEDSSEVADGVIEEPEATEQAET
jgi:type I restriction enzyme S subunit